MKPGQKWTTVEVPIKRPPGSSQTANHGAYFVQIIAFVHAKDQISIGEIHFEDCNPKRTIGDCDFENGDFCHWHLDSRSTLKWQVGSGKQVTETYAPTSDHT